MNIQSFKYSYSDTSKEGIKHVPEYFLHNIFFSKSYI